VVTNRPIRVAVVMNILAPYRIPVFERLAQFHGIELRLLLCADTEPDRRWTAPGPLGFRSTVGRTCRVRLGRRKPTYLYPGLLSAFQTEPADLVLCGSTGLLALAAMAGARRSGAKFGVWLEACAPMPTRTTLIDRAMSSIRRLVLSSSDICIASSNSAVDALLRLGVDGARIALSPITVDVESFSRLLAAAHSAKPALTATPTVLHVGALTRRKGVDLLLTAFARAQRVCRDSSLVLVGEGPEQPRLAAMVGCLGARNVVFARFKGGMELAAHYTTADVFALFSRADPFGLVVQEAALAGLPLVCSKYAGAAHDLVRDGANGFVIDPQEVETNAELLVRLLEDEDLRLSMGCRGQELAAQRGPSAAAEALSEAVHAVMGCA
jgi:glycosyltransferase involved in cell wall biosynthesis